MSEINRIIYGYKGDPPACRNCQFIKQQEVVDFDLFLKKEVENVGMNFCGKGLFYVETQSVCNMHEPIKF